MGPQELIDRVERLRCVPRCRREEIQAVLRSWSDQPERCARYEIQRLRLVESYIEPLAGPDPRSGDALFAALCREHWDQADVGTLRSGLGLDPDHQPEIGWLQGAVETEGDPYRGLYLVANFWLIPRPDEGLPASVLAFAQVLTSQSLQALGKHQDALEILETWLGITENAYCSAQDLASALSLSQLVNSGSLVTQANFLVGLASALHFVDARGPRHAALLLETWLGVPEQAYRTVQELASALSLSRLAQIGDPVTQANLLMRLADALRFVDARGSRHAALLLETWLGVPQQAYRTVQELASALSLSRLAQIGEPVTQANLLMRLADALRYVDARGSRHAALLLETWLGVPQSAYRSAQQLASALSLSPLAKIRDPITQVNLLMGLASALRFVEAPRDRHAALLLETWLGVPLSAYHSAQGLASALSGSQIVKISSPNIQATFIAAIADALIFVDRRGPCHSVLLIETWLGVDSGDYHSEGDLRAALNAPPFAQIGAPDAQATLITSLASALPFVVGRGSRHAARLLETWLGIPESSYSTPQDLASALALSPLSKIGSPITQANLLMRLGDVLRGLDGRGDRQATLLLETWLGVSEGAYHSTQNLACALSRSPLTRIDSHAIQASFLTILASALRFVDGRGDRHAALVLEAWLRLPEEPYCSAKALASALSSSRLAQVEDPVAQANLLLGLAKALGGTDSRGSSHAARLIVTWIGVPESAYRSSQSFASALSASPLGKINDPVNQFRILVDLTNLLLRWNGQSSLAAPLLLESWLGVPESDYHSVEDLASALSRSPLAQVGDLIGQANFLMGLATALRFVDGRGPRHAALLLEAWLGVPLSAYHSAQDLASALSLSPLAQIGSPVVQANFLRVLADALSFVDARGSRHAALLLETWLGVPLAEFASEGSALRGASAIPVVNFAATALQCLGAHSNGALELAEGLIRYLRGVTDSVLADPAQRRDFLGAIRSAWLPIRDALFAAIRVARGGGTEDPTQRAPLEILEARLLEAAEWFDNRRLVERFLEGRIDGSAGEPPEEWSPSQWPLRSVPRDLCLDLHEGYLPTVPLGSPLSALRSLGAPTQTGHRPLEGTGDASLPRWAMRLDQETEPFRTAQETAWVIRCLFDGEGRLHAWLCRVSPAGLEILGRGSSEAEARRRLELASLVHDLDIEAHWCEYVEDPDEWQRFRDQHLTLWLEGQGKEAAAGLAEALPTLHRTRPRLAGLIAALLEEFRSDDDRRTQETLRSAIRDVVQRERGVTRHRTSELRQALEGATARFREAVEVELGLHDSPFGALLGEHLNEQADLLWQVEGPLLQAPLSLLRLPRRGSSPIPLYRTVASTGIVLSMTLRKLAQLQAQEESASPRRSFLSSTWLPAVDWRFMRGLAHMQAAMLALAEVKGWTIWTAGDRPAATAPLLSWKLSATDGAGVDLAVCGGHGSEIGAGILLSPGQRTQMHGREEGIVWKGEGSHLDPLDLLFFVACSIGRLSASGALDTEGFYAELAARRARSVIAARWPIADAEAATFATEVVKHYIEALEQHGRAAPFLRARALNGARKKLLDDPTLPENVRVGEHLASAFEIYGRG